MDTASRDWLKTLPCKEDLGHSTVITAPTPVLHGQADTLVPIAHGRHTADVIPDASLVAFPDHGHLRLISEIPATLGRPSPLGSGDPANGIRVRRSIYGPCQALSLAIKRQELCG
jgi:hypothetical protein